MMIRIIVTTGQQNSHVLDDQKMNEDNQKFRSGCPPDYQIFWERNFGREILGEKFWERNFGREILKITVHTNSSSFYSGPFLFQQIYPFGNL